MQLNGRTMAKPPNRSLQRTAIRRFAASAAAELDSLGPRAMKAVGVIAGLLLTTALATGQGPDRVGFKGFGKVRIGMDLQQLMVAIGAPMTVEDEVTHGCTFAYPTAGANGVSFMIISGIVARIDVDGAGIRTISGAGVGDTEEWVQHLYGGALEVSEGYAGHLLTLRSADRRFGLVFETDGHRVTSYRIGRSPEFEYVEGCL